MPLSINNQLQWKEIFELTDLRRASTRRGINLRELGTTSWPCIFWTGDKEELEAFMMSTTAFTMASLEFPSPMFNDLSTAILERRPAMASWLALASISNSDDATGMLRV